MRIFCQSLCLVLLVLACGCGPKDIGEGSSLGVGYASEKPVGVAPEDQLRYPVMGSNSAQRMLYYHSRPDVMEQTRNWQQYRFNRMTGRETSPENPAYRERPKQQSPFRQ